MIRSDEARDSYFASLRTLRPAVLVVLSVWCGQALALDGYLAYTRGSTFAEGGTLYVATIAAGTATRTVRIDGTATCWGAQISPDGTRLAYARKSSAGSEIVICNIDGTGKAVKATGLSGDFSHYGSAPRLCWRIAGKIIFSNNKSSKIFQMNVDTGAVSTFLDKGTKVCWVSVSANGRRVNWYEFRDGGRGIHLYDFDTGVHRHPSSECGCWISPGGQYYTNNYGSHQSMGIKKFSDANEYKRLTVNPGNEYWNDQGWSNNSDKWIIYPQGQGNQLPDYSNCYARNIETGENVKLTKDNGHDFPYDLWVGSTGGPSKPSVATKNATNVATSSARLNGELTWTGGENPTVKIHWGDNDAGTGTWDHVENLGTKGVGTFYKDVSGLASGKTYYFRCYASNSAGGTWASSSKSFTTGSAVDPTVITYPSDGADLIEGQQYTLTGTGAGTLSWLYDANSDGQGEIPIGTGASVALTIPTGVTGPRTITIYLDAGGGRASVTSNIAAGQTNGPPSVGLTASPTSGTAPLAVSFDANSSDPDGDALTHEWDFDYDGSSFTVDDATGQAATAGRTYRVEGTYTAAVRVSDGQETVIDTLTITVTGASSGTVVIECEDMTLTGYAAEADGYIAVDYGAGKTTGTASASFPGSTGRYRVEVVIVKENDGQPTLDVYVAGALVGTIDYALGAASRDPETVDLGELDVTSGAEIELIGTLDAGAAARVDKIIFTPAGSSGNSAPTASLSADPTSGDAPLTVTFDAHSSDPDGDALTHEWDFDYDGSAFVTEETTGATSTAGHVYEVAGTYTAAVRVSDGRGGDDIATVTVTVAPAVAESIAVLSPSAGEAWYAGTTRRIRWTTAGIDDVYVLYSTEGGAAGSWKDAVSGGWNINARDPRWCDYAWQVPDEPSTDCVVLVMGYFGEAPTESGVFEIRAVTDSDSDGMDDGWETTCFGDLSHDGSADTDGDGATDYDEFMVGTDPRAAVAGGSGVGLSCAATARAGPPKSATVLPALALVALIGRMLGGRRRPA